MRPRADPAPAGRRQQGRDHRGSPSGSAPRALRGRRRVLLDAGDAAGDVVAHAASSQRRRRTSIRRCSSARSPGADAFDLRSLDVESRGIPELEIDTIPDDATVIDLRSRDAFAAWHWPGALHLDFEHALAASRSVRARSPLRPLLRVRTEERAPRRADAPRRLRRVESPRRPRRARRAGASAWRDEAGAALADLRRALVPATVPHIFPPLDDNALSKRMAIGLVLGAGLGTLAHFVAPDSAAVENLVAYGTAPIGTVFLRLLFMLVIPLLVSALALGVAGPRRPAPARTHRPQDARLHGRGLGASRCCSASGSSTSCSRARAVAERAAPRAPQASAAPPRRAGAPEPPASISSCRWSRQPGQGHGQRRHARGDGVRAAPRHRPLAHADRGRAPARGGARRVSTTSRCG